MTAELAISESAFATTVITVAILGWSVVGLIVYRTLMQENPPAGFRVYLWFIGGPFVWISTAYTTAGRARRAILKQFGVEHYDCCGGKDGGTCDHGGSHSGSTVEPSPYGHSNQAGQRRGHGYPSDLLANHPGIR